MSRGLKWSGFSVGTQLAYWHWQVGRQQLSIPSVADAETFYREALQESPLDAELHFRLGFILHQTGDRESALRYYERSLSLSPNTGIFHEHLGRLHFEERSYSKAITLFKQAIQSGPVQPMTLALLAHSYYETHEYELALEGFRHLVSIDLIPEVEGVMRHQLILTLAAEGNLGGARRACLTLLETHRLDYDLLMQLSDNFVALNCISPGKEILCSLIKRREEFLPARQKYLQILNKESQIEALLPGIYASDEEKALREISKLMRFGHEKIAKALLSLRDADSPLIRQNILEYCCRFGYLPWGEVAEFLRDDSLLVRKKAVEYLSRFGPPSMAQVMAGCLDDCSPKIRGYVARFFKHHGTMEHVETLKQSLENEEDSATRIKLRAAIMSIQRRHNAGVYGDGFANMGCEPDSAFDKMSLWVLTSTMAGIILLYSWLFFR